MNTQQKFINNLLQKVDEDTENKKPTKQCNIDYGMFKGAGKVTRERSVDSDDFKPHKKKPAQKKKPTKPKKLEEKQYKRKPVDRLKSVAL